MDEGQGLERRALQGAETEVPVPGGGVVGERSAPNTGGIPEEAASERGGATEGNAPELGATEVRAVPKGGRTLALRGNRQLVVERDGEADVLRIVDEDGGVSLTVHVTPEGPVLRFRGNLALETSGDLGLSARRVAIEAREGIAIRSGGDAHLEVEGDLHSHARIQNISADLGNVNVKANDDVKLNGERVMVNC